MVNIVGTCARMEFYRTYVRIPTARRITIGADKGYDTREFVTTCRSFEITPHVAMKQRHSALDRRTSRHAGYAASQRVRKRVEEIVQILVDAGACERGRLRRRFAAARSHLAGPFRSRADSHRRRRQEVVAGRCRK